MTRLDQIDRKVAPVGAARCDICESVVAECIEIKSGFFGAFPTYMCRKCIRTIMEQVLSE